MGCGITVQKPFDMADCGCELTGRAKESDVAADGTVCVCVLKMKLQS